MSAVDEVLGLSGSKRVNVRIIVLGVPVPAPGQSLRAAAGGLELAEVQLPHLVRARRCSRPQVRRRVALYENAAHRRLLLKPGVE